MREDINLLELSEETYHLFINNYADNFVQKSSIDIDRLLKKMEGATISIDIKSFTNESYFESVLHSVQDLVIELTCNYPNYYLSPINIQEILKKDCGLKLRDIVNHCANFVRNAAEQNDAITITTLNQILISSYTAHLQNLILFFCNRIEYIVSAQHKITLSCMSDDTISFDFSPSGDYHNGGQAVFPFSVGKQDFYFKPRPASTDEYVLLFMRWLSNHTQSTPTSIPDSQSHEDFSIQESADIHAVNFSKHNDEFISLCASQTGELTYICWLLGISDINNENYDLTNDGIVLFDTEAVSVSRLESDAYENQYMSKKYYATNDVFMSQLILPAKQKFQKGVHDFSMLSSLLKRIGSDAPEKRRYFINKMQDSIRASQKIIKNGQNEFRAILNDFIQSNTLNFRIVPRPTCDYGHLIELLCNPLCASDDDQKKVILSALANTLIHQPWNKEFIAEEIKSIMNFEVPFFYRNARDMHLYSRGKVLSENFFGSTPVEETLLRLEKTECVKTAQTRMIEISACLDGVPFSAENYWPDLQQKNKADHSSDYYIQSALKIGSFLKEASLRYDDDYFWPAPIPFEEEGFTPLVTGPDLYTGAAGIAVFFAALSKITNNKEFTTLAHSMTKGIRTAIDDNIAKNVSFLDGQAGMIFASVALSNLLGIECQDYDKEISAIAKEMCESEMNDFSQGSAGGIYVVAMSNLSKSKKEELVTKLADHLLGFLKDETTGFINPMFEDKILGGFAHGEAGMAFALSIAHEITGNAIYALRANQAFERETCRFKDGIYMDGRTDHGSTIPASWCFGSSGVAIAAELSSSVIEPHVFKDLQKHTGNMMDACLHDTGDWCICHGCCGIVEAYVLQGKKPQWPDLAMLIQAQDGKILENRDIWLLTPGLFTGLAGVGYQLLRSAAPNVIPGLFSYHKR